MSTEENTTHTVHEFFDYNEFKKGFNERYADRKCSGVDWLLMLQVVLSKAVTNAFIKDEDASIETVWMNDDPEARSIDPSYAALYHHRYTNESGKTVYEWLLKTYLVDTCKIVDGSVKGDGENDLITSFMVNGFGLTDVTVFAVEADGDLEEDAYLKEASEFADKVIKAVIGLSRTINITEDSKEGKDERK